MISGGTEGGIWLYESSTITGSVNNAGTIVGTAAPGIFLSSESSIGGVTNSGLIRGDNGPGIFLSSSSSVQGSIVNQSGGTISGSDYSIRISDSSAVTGAIVNQANAKILGVSEGIRVEGSSTVSGGITNSGLIQATTFSGGAYNSSQRDGAITVLDHSTITGNIANNVGGTLSGFQKAIRIESSLITGNIINSGVIKSNSTIAGDTISIGTSSTLDGSLINNAGAAIVGSMNAIRLMGNSTISGNLENSGQIIGTNDTANGIYLFSGTLAGHLINRAGGLIEGGSQGVNIATSGTVGGDVVNNGTILGREWAGLQVWGTVDNIVNTGTIRTTTTYSTASAAGLEVGSAGVVASVSNSGLISGTGMYAVHLANTNNPFVFDNTGTIQGNVYLGNAGNTLNLNGPSSRVIGNVSNDGASSTVNVNGTFTSEGTFNIGDFNVNDGGLFNWTTPAHTITANTMTVNTGGLLNVGTGNQTLNGDYVQESGGTFRFSLTNPETYGNMNVSGGNATLADGAKIDVRLNGRPGERIDGVIRTTGGVDATADKLIVTDNSLFYNFKADTSNPDPDSGTDKWLDLITEADTNALPNAVAPDNPAAIGVAQALQQIHNAGAPAGFQPVFDAMGGMSPEQLNEALLQLTPALQGAFAQAGINSLHSMNRIIQSRVESVQGLNSGDAGADQYAWARVFGNWGDQDNHRGAPGFETQTQGGVLGMDMPINDRIRAGGLFTYARSDIASKIGNANIDVDTFEIAAYGSYNIDPQTDVNAQVDFALNSADSQRRTFMGNMANANFDSFSWHVGTGIGHVFKLAERTSVTPSMRLDYTNFGTEGYTETGAGPLNLAIDSSTYQEFLMTADTKLTQRLTDDGFKLVVNGGAGYDFINQNAQASSTFTGGGPNFVTNGLDVSPWLFRGGLALIKEAGNGLEFSARYDTEGRTSGYINQTASLKVRWSF